MQRHVCYLVASYCCNITMQGQVSPHLESQQLPQGQAAAARHSACLTATRMQAASVLGDFQALQEVLQIGKMSMHE